MTNKIDVNEIREISEQFLGAVSGTRHPIQMWSVTSARKFGNQLKCLCDAYDSAQARIAELEEKLSIRDEAIVGALRTTLQETLKSKQPEWRPIESHPKREDEPTYFLAYTNDGHHQICFWSEYLNDWCYQHQETDHPTH